MDIITIIEQYRSLDLHNVIDHDKFNHYAIVHHSSGIEGSTLTEVETRVLLDEGLTPKGKPLEHSLMVKDHYAALLFVLEAAKKKKLLSVEFIKEINAKVMRNTGSIHHTALGNVDEAKGEFRKENVSAGGNYFINYNKVPSYTGELVKRLQSDMKEVKETEEKLYLSFRAHFDLVSIHPFYDGNGRTSRLLMNYLQAYYKLPLAIIYQEDKKEYIEALQQTRKKEDIQIFNKFMIDQYGKFLMMDIQQFKKDMSRDLLPKKRTGNGKTLFF
jgi:Fic family protein